MAEVFKPGDIVQLKSGGPPMTVDEVDQYGVGCHWFSGGKHNEDRFNPDTLVRAKKSKKKANGEKGKGKKAKG